MKERISLFDFSIILAALWGHLSKAIVVYILFTFIYLDFSGLGCKNWDNLMWL